MNRRVELCTLGFNHLLQISEERQIAAGIKPPERRNIQNMRVATAYDQVLWKKAKNKRNKNSVIPFV